MTLTETPSAPTPTPVGTPAAPAAPAPATRQPAYQVRETDKAFVVTLQVPGVPVAGVETVLDGDKLIVNARRSWKAPADWKVIFQESDGYGYRLVLSLDARVDRDSVQAELRQGILTLTLGKAEALQPRKIEIQS